MVTDFEQSVYDACPVFIQNILCSIMGFFNERKRYGQHFKRFYLFLKESEIYCRKELELYQLEQLKLLLKDCYKYVPYYKQLFDRIDFDVDSVQNVKDIKAIPYMDKNTAINNRERLISTKYPKRALVLEKTSGTTGECLQFYISKQALQREYAFVWARRRPHAYKGDRYASFRGNMPVPLNRHKPPFWRENRYSNQTLFSLYHMKDDFLKYYVEKLNDDDYIYYQGFPSCLYILGEFIIRNRLRIKNPPACIFTSSEMLYPWQRQVIEDAFQSVVYDSYGMTELTTLLTQCKYGNYHINYEYGITEFQEIYKDEQGDRWYEMISTGFLNDAFPLLRYRTDDYVVMDDSVNMCMCKRPGPVIKHIQGRMDDIVLTPDGRKIGFLDFMCHDDLNIKEVQLVQKQIDKIDVYIVKKDGYTAIHQDKLLRRIRAELGGEIEYDLIYADSIPRLPNGKFKLIVSEL